jgi:hypothetical protein
MTPSCAMFRGHREIDDSPEIENPSPSGPSPAELS